MGLNMQSLVQDQREELLNLAGDAVAALAQNLPKDGRLAMQLLLHLGILPLGHSLNSLQGEHNNEALDTADPHWYDSGRRVLRYQFDSAISSQLTATIRSEHSVNRHFHGVVCVCHRQRAIVCT